MYAEVNKREVDNSVLKHHSISLRTKKFNCIVVLGPTASGKTRIACALAGHFNGEVISVDSRQVYTGLDIGTGKDLHEYEINGKTIPVHLININHVNEQFYLHDFMREAEIAFKKISAKNRLPVFCGGTGLYLDALRRNFSFTTVPESPELREALEKLDKNDLLEKLDAYPPEFTSRVDRNSRKRIIRGIEIAGFMSAHGAIVENTGTPYRPLYIGLALDRETLKQRIATRLATRLEGGLIEEVHDLLDSGIAVTRLEQLGLEYKFVSRFIKGELTRTQLHDQLLTAIFQFSKRQATWFRKMEKEGVEIKWIDPSDDPEDLFTRVKTWITE